MAHNIIVDSNVKRGLGDCVCLQYIYKKIHYCLLFCVVGQWSNPDVE